MHPRRPALASGVRGAGPFFSPSLLYSTTCINHTGLTRRQHTVHNLDRVRRTGALPAALGQQTIDNNNVTLSCLSCPACDLRELRAGRRRFDGRCFRCSKTGCALHTGHADYEEIGHWHAGVVGGGLAAGTSMASAI
jgi:hypothetical protein